MKNWYLKHKEGANYAFWCVMTTLVSWTAYTVYAHLFGGIEGLPTDTVTLISNTLSWVTAVTFSFIANKIRVFESKSWNPRVVVPEILKFYSSRALVGVVGDIGLPTLLAVIGLDAPLFGVEGLVSKMVVTPVVICMNYLFGKFFVFRKKKETKSEQ